jgi:hypothetical protein
MSEECPAGCCPHGGIDPEAGCPDDLPQALLPERAVHLYACQMLSTYKIGAITGVDRQRITRLLHEAGINVKPSGAGRRMTRRTAENERLDQLMARLYLEQRMPSTQIAGLTGIPDHTVLARLRANGVPIRTRGRNNREDRAEVSQADLDAMYLLGGLSADEVGKLLGVSRNIVLRSAHDQGLPVRVGGAPPSRGPSESSCSPPCTPTRRSAASWPGTASPWSPVQGRSGNASRNHRRLPPPSLPSYTKAAGSARTTSGCSPAGPAPPLPPCCAPAVSSSARPAAGPRSCAAGARAEPDSSVTRLR